MLRNYITIATRNLMGSKLYSSINIFGLSIGIAICLILSLVIIDQLSYDRDNANADNIYRVVHRQQNQSQSNNVALTQGILAPELAATFAEVRSASRVALDQGNILVEGKEPVEKRFIAVDPSYFDIFTLPTTSPKKNIPTDDGILLSESEAIRVFGNVNVIGEVIAIKDIAEFKVEGVYKDQVRSHLRADYIISFSWIEKTKPYAASWNFNSFYTYVLLSPEADAPALSKKINTFVHQHVPESWSTFEYFLQPLLEIHLDSSFVSNPSPAMGKTLVISFGAVGLIILALACFNYMNMATARSMRRALEVGIRKVMGAYRRQLIIQFLSESIIICTLSFVLGIVWAYLALRVFQSFTNTSQIEVMRFDLSIFFNDYRLVIGLVVCNFLIAIFAGSYPAFFLSRYVPAAVLKGRKLSDSSKKLRRTIVSGQFMITTVLVILVVVIFRQIDFMKTKDLGFNKDGLMLFAAVRQPDLSLESFKTELQKNTGVKQVCSASSLPGRLINITTLKVPNTSEELGMKTGWVSVDHDYIPTLEITLLAGRNFYSNGSDEETGIIINEKAANALGFTPDEAIGKRVSGFIFRDSLPGEIIGVVKDYHVSSLRKEIMPLALNYSVDNNRFIVRIDDSNPFSTRDRVKSTMASLLSGPPMEPLLMNDYLDNVYLLEEKLGELLTFFTMLAVIIGCLGLYALSAYEGEQRFKELGIRKIMGASSLQLLVMLSVNYLRPVLIAFFLAMPVAYFLGNIWLEGFPYHTPLSASVFLQSAFWIMMLGWITILSQGIRASRLNPADVLRHE